MGGARVASVGSWKSDSNDDGALIEFTESYTSAGLLLGHHGNCKSCVAATISAM